jgi:hypothetical protein
MQIEVVANLINDESVVGGTDDAILLQNTSPQAMKIILDYCTHICTTPSDVTPLVTCGKLDRFSQWETQFVDQLFRDPAIYFHVLAVAYFLCIRRLFAVLGRRLQEVLTHQSAEKVGVIFGTSIPPDTSDAEFDKLMSAHPWIAELK